MFTSPARFLLTLAATLVLLTTMWINAAHAEMSPDTSFEVAVVTAQSTDVRQREMVCERRPLMNGRVGETVLVCDVPAVKAPSTRKVRHATRVGHTVIVARLGTRI